MVEVFKTNVKEMSVASGLLELLQGHFPNGRINFDLDDCDNILRVEAHHVDHLHIISLMEEQGFHCAVLE